MFYPKADTDLSAAHLLQLRQSLADQASRYSPFVRKVCAKSFGTPPRSVTPFLERGTFHLIFDVVDSAGGEWIVRIADGATPDFGLKFDAWAGDHLPARGIPVPKVKEIDLSRRHAPFEFAIVRRARGVLLADLPRSGAEFASVLGSLGEIIRRLHAVTLQGFGLIAPSDRSSPDIGQGSCPTWTGYILKRMGEHIGICRTIAAISDEEAREISELIPRLLRQLPDTPARLLHGDLGSHNIFVVDGCVSSLIDWEDCVAGDPVYDIAFWGSFHSPDALPHFLRGYFGGSKPAPDFDVRYWLYYLRVALAKTVLRHRLGYADPPGRPPASRRIQLALGHLTAVR